MRFDEHSFQDEITNKAEAQSCYKYFTQNLQEFQKELYHAGIDYDEAQAKIDQVWKNLITSCDRVGYSNEHMEEVKKHIDTEDKK